MQHAKLRLTRKAKQVLRRKELPANEHGLKRLHELTAFNTVLYKYKYTNKHARNELGKIITNVSEKMHYPRERLNTYFFTPNRDPNFKRLDPQLTSVVKEVRNLFGRKDNAFLPKINPKTKKKIDFLIENLKTRPTNKTEFAARDTIIKSVVRELQKDPQIRLTALHAHIRLNTRLNHSLRDFTQILQKPSLMQERTAFQLMKKKIQDATPKKRREKITLPQIGDDKLRLRREYLLEKFSRAGKVSIKAIEKQALEAKMRPKELLKILERDAKNNDLPELEKQLQNLISGKPATPKKYFEAPKKTLTTASHKQPKRPLTPEEKEERKQNQSKKMKEYWRERKQKERKEHAHLINSDWTKLSDAQLSQIPLTALTSEEKERVQRLQRQRKKEKREQSKRLQRQRKNEKRLEKEQEKKQETRERHASLMRADWNSLPDKDLSDIPWNALTESEKASLKSIRAKRKWTTDRKKEQGERVRKTFEKKKRNYVTNKEWKKLEDLQKEIEFTRGEQVQVALNLIHPKLVGNAKFIVKKKKPEKRTLKKSQVDYLLSKALSTTNLASKIGNLEKLLKRTDLSNAQKRRVRLLRRKTENQANDYKTQEARRKRNADIRDNLRKESEQERLALEDSFKRMQREQEEKLQRAKQSPTGKTETAKETRVDFNFEKALTGILKSPGRSKSVLLEKMLGWNLNEAQKRVVESELNRIKDRTEKGKKGSRKSVEKRVKTAIDSSVEERVKEIQDRLNEIQREDNYAQLRQDLFKQRDLREEREKLLSELERIKE